MKLFGRKSAGRAAVRPVLAHGLGTVMLGEWPRSYEAQVREGYAGNAVAQRAVRLVAEGVASVPLAASDDAARVLVTATSGGQALLETLAIHLLLHGNGYVQLICDARGTPVELFALRPERVRVESDARGWPVAYLYRVGEAALRIPADEMVHIRSHHPLDDHYGLGCLDAASGPIAIHNAATKWNKALLDNAARPSGALVYAPGGDAGLSSEQFDRLKTELSESYSGALNAGRPMLLEGGLSWQAMSLSPSDMDFIALKANAAREIALAFGVPPMLLGLPGDATYANYREANKALWRQTILPLAGKMLDAIAQALRPHFDGLSLSVDPDRVPALSEDRERLWMQVRSADFLTLDEKREMVGLAALPVNDNDPAPPPIGPPPAEPDVEVKFNPWHDPDNGQFTFAGAGNRHGDGGHAGDGGRRARGAAARTANMAKPPESPVSVDPNSGARTYRDGRVEIALDPAVPYRHYKQGPQVMVDEAIAENVNALAKDFKEKSGKTLTLTSGSRSKAKQARAMYDKFEAGSQGADYSNRAALNEIRAAYLKGKEDKLSRNEIVAVMRSVIDAQTKKGTYISYHLSGRAVDIRTVKQGFSAADKAILRASVALFGGKFHEEFRPPHIHIEFPQPESTKK